MKYFLQGFGYGIIATLAIITALMLIVMIIGSLVSFAMWDQSYLTNILEFFSPKHAIIRIIMLSIYPISSIIVWQLCKPEKPEKTKKLKKNSNDPFNEELWD